jgi:hypothetical protein
VSRGRIFLTIDLDLVDHMAGGAAVDELGPDLDPLLDVLRRHRHWRTTWLVRLDAQSEDRFGSAAAPHAQAAARLSAFVEAGHELAWHPHCYARQNGGWVPNPDGESVASELCRYAPLARALGARTVRMGWAFHTNATLRVLADAGFLVDSSAIPRPVYPWDRGLKDWSSSPRAAYFPSVADYRIPGSPSLPILELPMSVGPVRAPYDDGEVVRYLNPAYRPEALSPLLSGWFDASDDAVLVTHAHELFPRQSGHSLIASSADAFEENVVALERGATASGVQPRFLTLSEARDTLSA